MLDPDLLTFFSDCEHFAFEIVEFFQQILEDVTIDGEQVAIAHCGVRFRRFLALKNIFFAEHGALDEVTGLEAMLDLLCRGYQNTAGNKEVDLVWLATFIEEYSSSLDPHRAKHDQEM